MKLIYLPLEKYKERYTEYLSGMVKTYIDKYNIPCVAIQPHQEVRTIGHGRVLDTFERCYWGFAQTAQLVQLIIDGTVKTDDVIYIEDFWHPGFEMIPYALTLQFGPGLDDWPGIYSFCHAQSVDPYDFTAPMAWWMRGMEQAWSTCQLVVFTAAKELRELLISGGIGSNIGVGPGIVPVGTVFNGEYLRKNFYDNSVYDGRIGPRKKQVVFSSRWDPEKNPQFFCSVVEKVIKQRPDIKFIVCSGRRDISEDEALMAVLKYGLRKYSKNFEVRSGISKSEYYEVLNHSMIQFNCADQDFVSYTLLEAAYYGCAPLYPNYLTFPDAVNHSKEFLYERGNTNDAAQSICNIIDHWYDRDWELSLIYEKYEHSFPRMLSIMGFDVGEKPPTLSEEHESGRRK